MARRKTHMTLMEHLEELRRVLVVCTVAVGISTALVYGFFRHQLYDLVTFPLRQYHVPLIFIGLGEAFLTQIKLALAAGFVLALPIVLWQVWGFIVPALQPGERRVVGLTALFSLIAFFVGAAFAYFTVFRFAARFLITVAGPGVTPMLSIGHYVSFLISFLIPFGLAFELPIVAYFLARWGVVTASWLARHRRPVVVIIFIAAAALTPGPDVFSQLLMAGPLLGLYEISILVAKMAAGRAAVVRPAQEG
ncbi:MAG: twin-arginine translocase subunit TatC [Bacillota bacterium]|nr:twin-arginine translocase subunit TatC [Bacillota bacterium]MDI7248667.1 twin-arginine translocase subunit TatC [Bacillota bacterium]